MGRKFKIIFLAIFFLTFFIGEPAFASFNDEENSTNNTFSAGTLDMTLRSGQGNFISPAEDMKPGDSTARDIYIKKEGSLPFKYTAHSESIFGSCDEELYDVLKLKVWYNWYFEEPSDPDYHKSRRMFLKYNGLLKDFDLRALNPDDSDLQIPGRQHSDNKFYSEDEHWFYFQIYLPDNASDNLQDKTCEFKFVFEGWQTNFANYSQGFSDTEEISNTIAAGEWVSPGDVIINEIMWMGSSGSCTDEWIELKNNTDYDIDISNWRIDGAVAGGSGHLEIPHGYTIPANGYFLIANKKEDKSAISDGISVDLRATQISLHNEYNKNGALVLKDKEKRVIDSTPLPIDKEWPAGNLESAGGLHQSMERNNIPGDGTDYNNWHTCINESCNDTTYWDDEGNNYGTPKHNNLSANDPTADDYQENQNVDNGKEEKFEEKLDKTFEDQAEDISEDFETGGEDPGTKEEDFEAKGEDPKDGGDNDDGDDDGEEGKDEDGDEDVDGEEEEGGDSDDGDGEQEKTVDGIQAPK